jgi:hypothetical protein
MKTAPGIDYGCGVTNVDGETGIRFGVIALNDLSGDAAEDIFTHGEDVGYAAAIDEIKDSLQNGFRHVMESVGLKPDDNDLSDIADQIMQDQDWNYESSGPYEYEGEGLSLRTMSDNTELFVLKSPYYTHCQFCSPCAPGAGYLMNPCPDGPKTYCLGHDWFEDGKAPYPVYSVETGELV